MTGECGIADSLRGNLCERWLQGCQKLCPQLAVQIISSVAFRRIAADICVEKHRVCDPVAVLSITADRNIQINSCSFIYNTVRHRIRCSVLVADNFLCVDIVDSLVLWSFPAKRESSTDGNERVLYGRAEISCKYRRLATRVIDKLSGLRADFGYLPLIDKKHALPVRHRDDRPV